MARQTGLGRGLGALLDDNAFDEAGLNETTIDNDAIALSSIKGKVLELSISDVDTYQDQPRKSFDEEKLEELAQSIKTHGVVQPIIVRQSGNRYTIIAGERRYRASRIAKLKTIPAIVKEIDSKQQLEISIIENLQRENLNPLEEAAAIKLLMTQYDLTQEKVSERIGKSRSAIANILRLLQLPEKVRLMIYEGKLSTGHAKCLGGLSNDYEKNEAAEKIFEQGLSVRDTEKMVRKMNKAGDTSDNKQKKSSQASSEVIEVETQMSNALETKVKLNGNFNKGKIVIEYYNKDQLDSLFTYFTSK